GLDAYHRIVDAQLVRDDRSMRSERALPHLRRGREDAHEAARLDDDVSGEGCRPPRSDRLRRARGARQRNADTQGTRKSEEFTPGETHDAAPFTARRLDEPP